MLEQYNGRFEVGNDVLGRGTSAGLPTSSGTSPSP